MAATQTLPVLMLMGPTASGKTDLATALVDALAPTRQVRLISMDSALVYRGMDIGTAKPSADELARYPHALVDIRDPAEPFSAADFVQTADELIRQAHADNALPVLVGGTMLYARAFRDGLADLPSANRALRERLRLRGEQEGWPALHQELQQRDPAAAAVIDAHNSQRLQRALEVLELTGKPLSWWWQQQTEQAASERLGAKLVQVALIPADRAALHQRIAARLDVMLAAGLVAEVAALKRRQDLSTELPALRAVGYRQVWEYLDGAYDAAEMRQRILAATRQLAKRQLTWLRRWPALQILEPAADVGANATNLATLLADPSLAKWQAARHSD